MPSIELTPLRANSHEFQEPRFLDCLTNPSKPVIVALVLTQTPCVIAAIGTNLAYRGNLGCSQSLKFSALVFTCMSIPTICALYGGLERLKKSNNDMGKVAYAMIVAISTVIFVGGIVNFFVPCNRPGT